MAKLSASALRSAAASAREKSAVNAVPAIVEQQVVETKQPQLEKKEPEKPARQETKKPAQRKKDSARGHVYQGPIHSEEGERKTEHVNLLITPSLSRKIGEIQMQGGFRSKNAAVIAVLEAYCDAAGIE